MCIVLMNGQPGFVCFVGIEDKMHMHVWECRESWVPLGKPQEVMGLDFYEAQANMEPLEVSAMACNHYLLLLLLP